MYKFKQMVMNETLKTASTCIEIESKQVRNPGLGTTPMLISSKSNYSREGWV